MNDKFPSGLTVYTRYFEFLRAENPDFNGVLDTAYQLRYQVYCEERCFLDPRGYPEHLERDAFDVNAVHFVGRHRTRTLPAGTARLVLASELGFPLQHYCELEREFAFIREIGHPALQRYGEISRLAVSRSFRQRTDDTLYGGPPRTTAEAAPSPIIQTPGINPLEAGPEIVAGLFKSLYQETRRRGLTHLIVAMERSLYLLLKRMGYHFHAIGPAVDYYGPVIPYVARIRDLEHYLYTQRRTVYDYWMQGLEPHQRPRPPAEPPPVR